MCNVDERICQERMKRHDNHLEVVDVRLNNYGRRIDTLEQGTAKFEVKIENLCDQIKDLVTTIKWGTGLLISVSVGFFIWYIQNIK